ncbi:MAG: alanine racemase, partial [Bradyrhizobium sp.]
MTPREIGENLAGIRGRIEAAARRSGRDAGEVKLVAVTKYVDTEIARNLVEAGCRHLGEARPQELWRKAQALAGQPIDWHLIGHLQRNKVARTLPLVRLIHSCDSLRLIESIDSEAPKAGIAPAAILLEVNVSGDATKHGFRPE